MTDSRPLLEVEEHPPPQPPVAAVPSASPSASGGTPTDAAAPEGAVSVAQAAEPPTPTPSPRLHLGHYLILVSLNSIGAFSSDCYIPNLSDIVDDLDATDQQVGANPNPHPNRIAGSRRPMSLSLSPSLSPSKPNPSPNPKPNPSPNPKPDPNQVSLTIQINWVLLGLATPVVGHLSDVH
eukprot:scaffold27162_cov57-Phaeocystis_antarctica.AAC.6